MIVNGCAHRAFTREERSLLMFLKSIVFSFLFLFFSDFGYSDELKKRIHSVRFADPVDINDGNNLFSPFAFENKESQEKDTLFKVSVFTIDTRNQKICFDTRSKLKEHTIVSSSDLEDFCKENKGGPYSSIIIVNSKQRNEGIFEKLLFTQTDIDRQNGKFIFLGLSGVYLSLLLQNSAVSVDDLSKKYIDNIVSGPVWDEDSWAINYIGHPYAGASYYVVARHAGLDKTYSFAYNTFMSTFFWEYGVEALAEPPSIQDLVVTPILGSALGEVFMVWSKKIQNQGGKLFQSEKLGTLALIFMNPMGSLFQKNQFFNNIRVYGMTPFTSLPRNRRLINNRLLESNEDSIGIIFEVRF